MKNRHFEYATMNTMLAHLCLAPLRRHCFIPGVGMRQKSSTPHIIFLGLGAQKGQTLWHHGQTLVDFPSWAKLPWSHAGSRSPLIAALSLDALKPADLMS